MQRQTARTAEISRGLSARVAALPQRRQELIADLGIAVAVAAITAVPLLPYRTHLHPLWLAFTLAVGQGIPLIWRRSRPVAVGVVVGAARVAFDQLGFGYAPFPLGPAIAVYTIFERRGPIWRRLTFALIVAGVWISQTAPGHNEPYDAIYQAVIFLTVWAAGTLSRTRRANLQAAHSRADRAEAELDRQTSLAAARERTRIARELHDIVAHHVSLIAVQAEAAGSLLSGQPEQVRRSVEIISDTARQALTELRRLLGVLRGPSERPGTAPTASLAELGGVLDQVRGAGLQVNFDVVGTPFPLAPGIDLTAYRIIQEALTNTLRHAQAGSAAVTLSYEPGYITVLVADSGKRVLGPPAARNGSAGAAPGTEPPLAGSGLGLAGIAERVTSCGGNLTVGPTAADGFAVTARLPAR